MNRFWSLAVVGSLVIASVTLAEEKHQSWKGSVADEDLQNKGAEIVVTEAAFKKLYETWKFAKEEPKVDFTKNVVVVATTRGGLINGKPVLKDGDLTFPAISTRDLRPGFRYLIVEFPKEGVKTFNGKELPKE